MTTPRLRPSDLDYPQFDWAMDLDEESTFILYHNGQQVSIQAAHIPALIDSLTRLHDVFMGTGGMTGGTAGPTREQLIELLEESKADAAGFRRAWAQAMFWWMGTVAVAVAEFIWIALHNR